MLNLEIKIYPGHAIVNFVRIHGKDHEKDGDSIKNVLCHLLGLVAI